MRKIILMLSLMIATTIGLMSVSSTAPSPLKKSAGVSKMSKEIQTFMSENPNFTTEDFLTLTPKKYKELTGKKLGLKKTIMLKAAQKQMKKAIANPNQKKGINKGIYLLLVIGGLFVFGLPVIGVGLATDFEGDDWWKCLLWSFLCILPGIIYALIKMKNYSFS